MAVSTADACRKTAHDEVSRCMNEHDPTCGIAPERDISLLDKDMKIVTHHSPNLVTCIISYISTNNMALVPPAPTLPGEAMLEIFIYPDPAFAANRPLNESNKFSDTARLEYLGRKATELAYMDLLRAGWPHSSAEQLQVIRFRHIRPVEMARSLTL
ncbi:hypothetical protein NUW54_g10895 [Trametes sanguinea]|uniref:Uncharacterized protein n=1 Tax=Trametes sanguinea TaxID=158606 RepID=A0ACC1NQA1_9APHY|nr:hypothetical protein NUW54_g10895 [Trametes sanguinea]